MEGGGGDYKIIILRLSSFLMCAMQLYTWHVFSLFDARTLCLCVMMCVLLLTMRKERSSGARQRVYIVEMKPVDGYT